MHITENSKCEQYIAPVGNGTKVASYELARSLPNTLKRKKGR